MACIPRVARVGAAKNLRSPGGKHKQTRGKTTCLRRAQRRRRRRRCWTRWTTARRAGCPPAWRPRRSRSPSRTCERSPARRQATSRKLNTNYLGRPLLCEDGAAHALAPGPAHRMQQPHRSFWASGMIHHAGAGALVAPCSAQPAVRTRASMDAKRGCCCAGAGPAHWPVQGGCMACTPASPRRSCRARRRPGPCARRWR